MKAEKQRTIAAGEFKAHCLALLDEVNATGEEIVITKRGKPVARICPLPPESEALDWRSLKGSVITLGDIVSPMDEEDWGELV